MSKKIFIQSIERPSALGINDWVSDTTGRKLKKSKIGRCTDAITALYSPKVGGLANYISYTAWINPETGTPHTNEKGEPIMLQEHLEKKWGKPAGYYTNRHWKKGDSLDPEKMTYFQRMSWKLNDGSTVLDLAKEDDEMGYYVMLASNLVANSEREWREHRWPKAQYFISIENESDEIKYKRNEIKSKAYAALHNSEFVDTLKRKVVSLLDLASTKATLTTEQVNNLLYDYIEKSGFLPGSNIDKFNQIYNLLNTAHGKEEFEARYLLKRAMDNRIVYEKQDIYTWVRPTGNIVIGDRYAEAIDYLLNPKKSSEVEELELQIKNKE